MGILNRINNLYRESGHSAVLKQTLIALHIYENFYYYLYKTETKPFLDESNFLPKIDIKKLTHKRITSKAELDELIADGFTFIGQDIDYIKNTLLKGAIAGC